MPRWKKRDRGRHQARTRSNQKDGGEFLVVYLPLETSNHLRHRGYKASHNLPIWYSELNLSRLSGHSKGIEGSGRFQAPAHPQEGHHESTEFPVKTDLSMTIEPAKHPLMERSKNFRPTGSLQLMRSCLSSYMCSKCRAVLSTYCIWVDVILDLLAHITASAIYAWAKCRPLSAV
jgi:hypothetical protein